MRLIDSTVLIDKLPIVDKDKQISLIGAVADMVCMISDCPTIDAVPVVRCKDCKHWERFAAGSDKGICTDGDCLMYEDGFCSEGERKEQNEK